MTGFAALVQDLPAGTLSAEIRSVNHRYLDLAFRLPDDLRAFEPALRERFSARLTRGKVECRIGFQKSANGILAPGRGGVWPSAYSQYRLDWDREA